MHSQRKHRRSTSTPIGHDHSPVTSTSTNTSLVTSDFGNHSGAFVLPTTSSTTSSGAQVTTVIASTTTTPFQSFIFTPTPTPSSQSSNPQPSSSDITSVSTTTVYPSPETITWTSPVSDLSSSQSPTPSSSSTSVPLTLNSRDGIIVLSLSILAGILSLLCAFLLWRWCRQRGSSEALENRVDAVVFHQSGTQMSGRTTDERMDSMASLTNLKLETASPSEMKSRLRERPSPSHRHSHDSDHPSPPITPIHNPSRFSPAPDIFDSRWPGRLVPVNEPWPRGGSPFTLDVSQIVVVSGGADASLQSNESEPGSGTRATTNPPSNHPLPEPENGQVVSGAIPVISPDVLRAKGELEARAQQPEVKQPGARTWDGPPPEESEKTESTKTGPPAYSPGDTQSIPPLPAPLPIPPAIPPAGIRPLPVPSGGAGRRRSAGRRMPVRR